MEFGCSSEIGQIKSILLKHPRDAFINSENTRSQWKELHYFECPDYERALEEYEAFISILKQNIPEILFLPRDGRTGLDSMYVRDAALVTDAGAVLCNMGKMQRRNEPQVCKEFLSGLGIPILGAISGEGNLEGGDVVLFNENMLAVGQGYRTNQEGIEQLKNLVGDFIREVVVVPLPHWKGPENVLHLMSFISPVDRDKALVYSRLMPVPFREWLFRKRIKLIEVPDSEYETMACNVLTLAPKKCLMLTGNPETKQKLEAEGIEVWEYPGEEISKKGAGGPTCLTRPLHRKN